MAQEFDLSRYTEAHARNYATALREICNGRKRSHWMWYVFPQIHGLIPYSSSTNVMYAVRSRAETEAFLADPYLGGICSISPKRCLPLKPTTHTKYLAETT